MKTIRYILFGLVLGLMCVNSRAQVTQPGLPTASANGQIPIAASTGVYTAATVTAGTGISVTNGANSVTIANTLTSSPMTLLKAANGTDASAGSTTLDSIAVSGLTAKDTLLIYVELTGTGAANMNRCDLVSTTDTNLTLAAITNGLALAGNVMTTDRLRQDQGGSTTVNGLSMGVYQTSTALINNTQAATTTAWTGSWTLGLRHSGIVSGTLKWSWAVYKVAGQ